MQQIQNYVIDILVSDSKIHSHQSFFSGEALDVELKGGGATDFRPVFEFIEKEMDEVQLLLYFTDLEGIFPKDPPQYNVKWVSPKEKEIPFGELILMED